MNIFTFAIFVVFCRLAHSYVVPEDHPDGTFFIQLDANGTALAEPVPISVTAPDIEIRHSMAERELAARSFPWYETGWYVTHFMIVL